MNAPAPSSAAPARAVSMIFHSRLWAWAAIALSVMICAMVSGLHVQQRQALSVALRELENIRQTRIDLGSGFLHLSLAATPDSPFGHAEGLALLQQAITSFEQSLASIGGVDQELVEDFRRSVGKFETRLADWKKGETVQQEKSVALRVAFNELDGKAAGIDKQIQRHLLQLSARLDYQFGMALAGAGLLLAIICGMAFHAGRTRDAFEAASRQSEARFRQAMEAISDGLWDWNVKTGAVYFSPAYWRMLGYDPDQAGTTLQNWTELIHPDDRDRALAVNQDCITSRVQQFRVEFRMKARDGSWKWILGRGRATERDAQGQAVRMIGTHVDITNRKRAEEALRESEERYRYLFDHNPQPMWIYDRNTLSFLEVNGAAVQHYGYSREEFLSMTILDIHEPEVAAQIRTAVQTIRGDIRRPGIYRQRKKDGSFIEVDLTTHDIQVGPHQTGRLVLANDVTERRRAEEEIRYLFDIIEKSLNEIYIFDSETLQFTYVNQGALHNLQYTLAEIRTITPVDIKPEMSEESFRARLRPLLDHEEETVVFETVHRRADGSLYPVEVHLQMMEAGGRHVFLAVIFNITERTRVEEEKAKLQEQLTQAQKMESIGRLAGGVAHDFNNMLGVIMGNADLAMDKIGPTEPPHKELMEIRRAAERSADLTRQLLAFARRQTVTPKILDLNETVEGMLKMLRRLIGENIELAWLPASALWPVKLDPSQIDQILANLCVNARDAITDVGKVTIETGNTVFDADYCEAHAGYTPGEYVLLAVSDSGCGMDRQTMGNIFEPFFTTKELGKGTGLGLATVYGIVRQNSGFIHVYSEPGQGTTFKIYLPRHTGEAAASGETDTAASPRGHGETVLVVEDEPALLQMTKRMLEMQGYATLIANTPAEAIRLAEEHRGPIRLLLTDVVMPDMNGRDLAARLRENRPEMQCLFMSGYTANVIAHHGVLDDGVHFLPKPFSRKDLAAGIRKALDNA